MISETYIWWRDLGSSKKIILTLSCSAQNLICTTMWLAPIPVVTRLEVYASS